MAGCEKEYCPSCEGICDRYHVRIFVGKKEIHWHSGQYGERGIRGRYVSSYRDNKNILRYMDENHNHIQLSKFKRYKSDKVRMVIHYPVKKLCNDCVKQQFILKNYNKIIGEKK